MEKKTIAMMLAIMVLLSAGFAVKGLTVGPAMGDFTFSRNGGNLQWTVFNTGDETTTYQISYYGEASLFTTPPEEYKITESVMGSGDQIKFGSEKKKSFEITVPGGDFKSIYFRVLPPENVEYGRPYRLLLQARISSSSAAAGSGVGVSVGTGGGLNLIFEDKAGPPTEYKTVDELATKETVREQKAKETNWLMIILLVAILVAILISIYLYYKKKQEEEE